jgi:site-specific DNA-adenine methylase
VSLALDAPFPWFGGKRRIASVVWRAFGDVINYVEPFFGSGAVLFHRPGKWSGNETINDLDGLVSNFWRAVKLSPQETAAWADWPVNENDLHARHIWLLSQLHDLPARLEADADWHDPKIAGWWVWGMACWIGSEFCSGKGPWRVMDGRLVHLGNAGQGVNRQLVHLGDNGRGVNRKRVHLGNNGQGVNRRLVHLGDNGQECRLLPWFQALSERLERVRVCSGDWSRVIGPSVTFTHGLTGVFLDPPYADTAGRDPMIYRQDSLTVAHDLREWAIDAGKRADMRIALCGYQDEHVMPADWTVLQWKAAAGYSHGNTKNDNRERERIWFSPACLPFREQLSLFDLFDPVATATHDAGMFAQVAAE